MWPIISAVVHLPLLIMVQADFYSERAGILEAEDNTYLGSDLLLSLQEEDVNDQLMALKFSELDQAFEDSSYPSSYSFFQSRPVIESSPVYQFLQRMPKGGALHLHDVAITTADWVIQNITYRDGLYLCKPEEQEQPPFFTWLNNENEINDVAVTCASPNSGWRSTAEWRAEMGAQEFDAYVKSFLTLNVDNPYETYPDINTVWVSFGNSFEVFASLLHYEPVFRDYYWHGMEDFWQDNVQYMEVRHNLPDSVCTQMGPECAPLSRIELAGMLKELSEEFLATHTDMCAHKIIFSESRHADTAMVEQYLVEFNELIDAYPDFVVGFDMAGQEDKGAPLIDFADVLLQAQEDNPNIKYYFHAGETIWNGQETDLNVMDALLLGTKRIGHGFGIATHPESKALAIENDVPIEVSPVSNQVLTLVKDLRNHPAAVLIEEGFPLVISSDNPGQWDAKGLSYDFYEAFMGLASRTMDLRLLKKLAFSSIEYSAMSETEKEACMDLMQSKWDEWILSVTTVQETDHASVTFGSSMLYASSILVAVFML